MAQSRSGKSRSGKSSAGKSGKNTYRASSARSSAARGSKPRASASQAKRKPSRRAQRRAQTNHLGTSILLAGLGLLVIALVLIRGESGWQLLRSWLFGIFGIMTYPLGPLLLYLAYLVASGYTVGKFTAKVLLMAVLCASVPVVFSGFAVANYTFVQIVKMLFAWGSTRFWAGGVLGGIIGATLLAFCGRPAANVLMLLVFALGLMAFFAVTPVDVLQFVAYYLQKGKQARAAAQAEETAYDTPLFGQDPEEEPLENLTQQVAPRPAAHRAFDVEREVRRTGGLSQAWGAAQPVAPQAPAAPVSSGPRPDFDVDLGPAASDKMLEKAVQNDPLEPVVIGPGGTFGLDPLEQLSRKKNPPAAAPAPEEDFSLHLDPQPAPAAQPEEEDVDALIRRAMGPDQPARDLGGEVSSEVRLDLPAQEEPFDTPLEPVAQDPGPTADVIPTLGGSFDVAGAAWNAGIPIAQVLAGQPVPTRPAAPVTPVTPATPAVQARPATSAVPAAQPASGQGAQLRVDATIGNSATPPITTPPSAAKATPEAQALAAIRKEEPKPYCYPSLNLFNAPRPEDESGAVREMKKNADVLVNTLDSFGVKTKILDICRGPSVTRYELQPQAGIKVSRITSLADDIALNLATAGVRIEAPIPGKPAVGIEVPNRIRSTVSIRSVFEAQNYINMRSPLTMALGKDIAGTAQVADLCKMPHLLIAGSTGSGKSVCVNSIIISFLFRSGPEDVKLILIDPKVVELAEYNGIPHLLMPVVTEPRKAAGALGASVAEMERRYKLFAENNVRDIKSYNKLAKQNPVLEHLPYIAIIIDELADLMMVAGKEVEDYICRIAQKARAAGIHLIVATQRPSVDVITGLIKANIPSRIAFAVSSQIDSRTILDTGGAEKLLGNGDMLFLPVGANKPIRVQGTYVTDEEIGAVLNFIKSTSDAQYDEEMINEMERRAVAEKGGKGGGDDGDGGALDPMFEQAVECVIEAGQASTSLLQRRCKLGYARAARIMDQMEQEKIIGPYEGAKPRSVLVTKAQWQERKLGADDGPAE